MNEKRFPVIVWIKKNETGEIRHYEDTLIEGCDEGLPNIYIWEEGNYGCDCNRRLFFARVKDEDEDWETECSDGLYSVNLQNPSTGEYYYKEFDEAQTSPRIA